MTSAPHSDRLTAGLRAGRPGAPPAPGSPRPRSVTTRSGAAQDEVRRHNLSLALSIVHTAGSITRSELTERMGLSRSTIKALVAELVALGVLAETGTAGARVGAGRPSLIVSPHRTSAQVLAADVGVDRVAVGAYRLGGQFAARSDGSLGGGSATPDDVVALLRELVADVVGDEPATPRTLGLSVALPAIVGHDGFVRFAPNLGWVDEPFGAQLRAAFPGLRILVGNDGDLGAVGEHLRGAGQGVDDLVYVQGDVGIGAGFVLGGRSVTGVSGYAGEVGHMVTDPNGALCRCGVRGCWETEVGALAIAAAVGWRGVSVRELGRHVRATAGGPHDARLREIAVAIGRGVGTLVNLLNPRAVVLGGLLGDVHAAVGDTVSDAVRGVALAACLEHVRLVTAECGEDAVLVGAAETMWQRLLADPVATLGAAS
jgi:predicted NBD/HSP70 family sugar kinase